MNRITLAASVLFSIGTTYAGELTLKGYLAQVVRQNQGFLGQKKIVEGSFGRKEEGELLVRPQLIANGSTTRDAAPIFAVFLGAPMPGVVVTTDRYTLGVSEQFKFGLTAALNYNVVHTIVPRIVTAVAPLGTSIDLWQMMPKLDLRFPLWRNLFGSDTKNSLELAESSALISHYSERMKLKSSWIEAEAAYWRLVIARKALHVRKELLQRANALQTWATRRTKMSLGDKADLFQANAIAELRQLELQTALDEERSASLAFNSIRGLEGVKVKDELSDLPISENLNLRAPEKVAERDDLLIAVQNERMARATALSAIEKIKPSVDLVGSVGLNGANSDFSSSLTQATDWTYSTTSVGVQAVIPLDFGLVSKSRSGREKEKIGAEWVLARKRFEQDQEWKDYSLKFEESKHKLRLVSTIEKLQREKLLHERDRLSRGRTTTNLVIQFEQDYSQALLSRILAQAEVTQIYTRMKLLGGSQFKEIEITEIN